MSVTKKQLATNVSLKLAIKNETSSKLINFFIKIIKSESSIKKVKISNFGTFYKIKTKKRIGRNPKTQDSYIIPEFKKLNFKPSNKVKEHLN